MASKLWRLRSVLSSFRWSCVLSPTHKSFRLSLLFVCSTQQARFSESLQEQCDFYISDLRLPSSFTAIVTNSNNMPWFCCGCNSGGFSTVYVDVCYDCNHKKCSFCKVEASDSLFMCSAGVCIPQPYPSTYPPPSYDTPLVLSPSLGVRLNVHTLERREIVNVASFPTGLSILTPPPAAKFPVCNGSHSLDGEGFGSPTDGKATYFWYCCNCQYGPFDYSLYAGCTSCGNHNRCSQCVVQQYKDK
ncbi:hypothetical protein P280DRAFT_473140 [Massarina eburnea CBS 473.64]|uniref:Uncharacterized protein n=1 Tax=Massarina eburnea CBS 473.64 TaxID=1395130 RepID=A0A6A6RMD2_9PLEO|nr:hypothetical protein P280DRAFT_473140 [Massarina eburnea CBS 473.64]